MSGILGIWNLDGRPVEPAPSSRSSLRPLCIAGLTGHYLWSDGPVGLACQLFRVTPESLSEVQPFTDFSAAVVFDGRLDDRQELLGLLGSHPRISEDSSDPGLVLAAYRVWEERFVQRLNGDFALALFDRRQRRLVLARDSLGVRPLHYTRTRNTFLFASEIKALLGHPDVSARPNEESLAGFLLAGRNMREGATFLMASIPFRRVMRWF